MTWRLAQLGNNLCDQDQIILELFENQTVNYVGNDKEFVAHLNCDQQSENLVLVVNQPVWISELCKLCEQHLKSTVEQFYIGVNRYWIVGNDTDIQAQDLVELMTTVVGQLGYVVQQQSRIERDLGRRFNFVQPLTWIYGNKNTNQN
jgi:molybdopterin converting factor small subunit